MGGHVWLCVITGAAECLCTVVDGGEWSCVVIQSCAGEYRGIRDRFVWSWMVVNGHAWSPMVGHGQPWWQVVVCGHIWLFNVVFGCTMLGVAV